MELEAASPPRPIDSLAHQAEPSSISLQFGLGARKLVEFHGPRSLLEIKYASSAAQRGRRLFRLDLSLASVIQMDADAHKSATLLVAQRRANNLGRSSS